MKDEAARYRALHGLVQKIKAAGRGRNLELAKYCGKDPSKTSRCFWSPRPAIMARAGLALSVLRWACALEGINLIVPDWNSLRLLVTWYSQSRDARQNFRAILKLSSVRFHQHFVSGLGHHLREPSGEMAIELLAYYHADARRREALINFLAFHLADHLKKDLCVRADPSPFHGALADQARTLDPAYCDSSWRFDPRLDKILRY
jgi:hypothetical protein